MGDSEKVHVQLKGDEQHHVVRKEGGRRVRHIVRQR